MRSIVSTKLVFIFICLKALRLYDLGRKKLLRKCENKQERIICSDVQEPVHFVKDKKRSENQLVVFAGITLS